MQRMQDQRKLKKLIENEISITFDKLRTKVKEAEIATMVGGYFKQIGGKIQSCQTQSI